MNNLISVVVPVYNVEKFLPKCLNSIISQTYKNLEIIVIDDGSTDNCPKICDDYAKLDKRIKVIRQKNAGLSEARNSGINNAMGKYIMFIDSDDYIDSNVVAMLRDSLLRNKTKIAICGRKYVFDDGKEFYRVKEKTERNFAFKEALAEMNRYYYFDMSANGKLFDKELFKQIRFPVGKLSEDFFVMPKLLELSDSVSYISEPFYNYFQRKNSITKNKKINEDFLEAAKKQMVDYENKDRDFKAITHIAYASAALTVYDSYIKNKVKCPKTKSDYYKQIVKDNWEYIGRDNELDTTKKIQFGLFLFSLPLYIIVFRCFRKIKRI